MQRSSIELHTARELLSIEELYHRGERLGERESPGRCGSRRARRARSQRLPAASNKAKVTLTAQETCHDLLLIYDANGNAIDDGERLYTWDAGRPANWRNCQTTTSQDHQFSVRRIEWRRSRTATSRGTTAPQTRPSLKLRRVR